MLEEKTQFLSKEDNIEVIKTKTCFEDGFELPLEIKFDNQDNKNKINKEKTNKETINKETKE